MQLTALTITTVFAIQPDVQFHFKSDPFCSEREGIGEAVTEKHQNSVSAVLNKFSVT